MKNTYAIVFEKFMNDETDKETVSLLVCSLINDLEEANDSEKPELLKTIEYVRRAATEASENSLDEEKSKFWLRISGLIQSVIEKEEGDNTWQIA